jgi:hypothetical protein
LKGCQKAVNFLADYYGVKRMRIIVDGKRVGKRKANGWLACYSEGKAFFSKRGLNRRNVLHEFYHHLIEMNMFEISIRKEENEANSYSRELLK